MLRIIDRYFKRIFKWNFKTLSQYFVVNTYIQFLLRKKPFNYYFRHLIILWSTHFYDRDFYTDWISPRSATIIYFSVSPRGRGWPWWRLLESCWDGGGWELFVSLHPRYCWHANRSVARTHSHILHCIGVYSISLYDMYIYIYVYEYVYMRAFIPILRKTSVEAGCAVHTHTSWYPHSHTHVGCCASVGARRPSSPVPPVCAGVSPWNFQLPNNKVPGWPNYYRERAARVLSALRIDTL